PNFVLANGRWGLTVSAGRSPVASGYARLDCSQPVTATLIYSLVEKDQTTTLGIATEFPAPPTTYAMFPLSFVSGRRTRFAISNDNDIVANFTVQYTDINGNIYAQIVEVPARSQLVRFVDELFTVPNTSSTGSLEIVSLSGAKFSVTGLVFA